MNKIFKEYVNYIKELSRPTTYKILKGAAIAILCVVVLCAIACFVLLFSHPVWALLPFAIEMSILLFVSVNESKIQDTIEALLDEDFNVKYYDFYNNFKPIKNKTEKEIRSICKYYNQKLQGEQRELDLKKERRYSFLCCVILASIISVLPDYIETQSENQASGILPQSAIIFGALFTTIIICYAVSYGYQVLQDWLFLASDRRLKYMRQLIEDLEGVLDTQFSSNSINTISASENTTSPPEVQNDKEEIKGENDNVKGIHIHNDQPVFTEHGQNRICNKCGRKKKTVVYNCTSVRIRGLRDIRNKRKTRR